jgi:membrane-associated protease RseP (regulator of RpoE activity)
MNINLFRQPPRAVIAAGLCVLLGACATAGLSPVDRDELSAEAELQRRYALEEKITERRRLDAVTHRVMEAAVPFCGDRTAAYYGLTVATRDSFGPAMAQSAADLYGLDEHARILSVTPGSPAARAGMRPGDIVEAVNGAPVAAGGNEVRSVSRALAKAGMAGADFRLGGSSPRRVTVTPKRVCNYPVRIVEQDSVNAYADGKRITLTRGMLWFARQDIELALVISHELAHNVMGHAGLLNFTGKKKREADADYVGLYFLARGGFEIERAPYFWRRIAAAFPQTIESSAGHPVMPYRFVALRKAAEEIRAKQAAGLPLIPRALDSLAEAAGSEPAPPET